MQILPSPCSMDCSNCPPCHAKEQLVLDLMMRNYDDAVDDNAVDDAVDDDFDAYDATKQLDLMMRV